MGWRLIRFYSFLLLIFYWLLLYSYFRFILILLLIEGVIVLVFLFFVFMREVYLMSLELMFLIMRIMVFEGVLGLCLLMNNYRVLGLNYYRLW